MYPNLARRYHLHAMDQDTMKARTKAFALRVIKLTQSLPATRAADVIGSNCCARPRPSGRTIARLGARSRADFINKLGIVEEEADESAYWLERLVESGLLAHAELADLIRECDEITANIVASIRTAKQGRD